MLNAKYEYSSVYVNLPVSLSEEIVDWGKNNIREDEVFHNPENPFLGREDDPHVTILYGIHADKPKESFKLLDNEFPINLKLGKIHIFKKSHWYDVLTISVQSEDLER